VDDILRFILIKSYTNIELTFVWLITTDDLLHVVDRETLIGQRERDGHGATIAATAARVTSVGEGQEEFFFRFCLHVSRFAFEFLWNGVA